MLIHASAYDIINTTIPAKIDDSAQTTYGIDNNKINTTVKSFSSKMKQKKNCLFWIINFLLI